MQLHRVVLVCLLLDFSTLAQDQAKQARFPDAVIYQSFLTRALMMRQAEASLAPDPKRPHVLQRRYPDLKLSLKDCQKIDDAINKGKHPLDQNNAEGQTFLAAAKQENGNRSPVQMSPAHKDMLKKLNHDREMAAQQIRKVLQATLDPDTFNRFDVAMSNEASAKVQMIVKGDRVQ
jgi:hypothetical protein